MKCRKTALLRFSKILFDRFHRARERERKQEEEEESLLAICQTCNKWNYLKQKEPKNQ